MKLVDKKSAWRAVEQYLRDQIDLALRQVTEARQAATHPDAKQEGKYDTRALEASYLAFGQSKRIDELQTNFEEFLKLGFPAAQAEVRIGSLVSVLDTEDLPLYFLLQKHIGAFFVHVDQVKVQVLSASAPMATALLGKRVGDEVTFRDKSFTVVEIA